MMKSKVVEGKKKRDWRRFFYRKNIWRLWLYSQFSRWLEKLFKRWISVDFWKDMILALRRREASTAVAATIYTTYIGFDMLWILNIMYNVILWENSKSKNYLKFHLKNRGNIYGFPARKRFFDAINVTLLKYILKFEATIP